MKTKIQKAYELIKIPNGFIKKYADGTAEYHELITFDYLELLAENGTLFYTSGGVDIGIFSQIKFIKPPFIYVQIMDSDYVSLNYSVRNVTTSSKGTMYIAGPIKRTGKYRINYHAYGFWK